MNEPIPPSQHFAGKTVLITGAAGGIGQATVARFIREGAHAIAVAVNLAALTPLAERFGSAVSILQADVADEAQVEAAMSAAAAAVQRIDIAVLNAGIEGSVKPLHTTPLKEFDKVMAVNVRGVFIWLSRLMADLTLAEWQRMMDVNLTGVFLCLKHELLHMKAHGGSIVNTASIGGLIALQGAAAYSASKHGVIGLSKNAATEYAQYGIRVNALCPGRMTTPMLGATEQQLADLAKRNPMKRLGTADEIAEMAAWLCSDRASFTNGAVMLADGGRLAAG